MAQASSTTNFSVTVPLPLASGWKDFGQEYASPTVTRQGDVVVVEGLVTGGGANIAHLPQGFQPSKRLIFPANTHESQCRVDVLPNGEIHYVAGPVAHHWISLSGITFTTKQYLAGLPGYDGEDIDDKILLSAYRFEGEKYSPKCTFTPPAEVPTVHDGRRCVQLDPPHDKPTHAPKVTAATSTIDNINFTFSANVFLTGQPADRWLLADWTHPWHFYFGFFQEADHYQFGGELRRNLPTTLGNFGSEGSQGLVTARGGVVKPGVWTHVVFVWNRDAGVAVLYVDGVKVGEAKPDENLKTLSGPLACPNWDLQHNDHKEWELGWKGDGSDRTYEGFVADVEIRAVALTDNQVKKLKERSDARQEKSKYDIPEGSHWQYDHWGGPCTALWQSNGELWMARNPAATSGTCVWKTTDGDAKKLLAGEHIKILWDNSGRQDLVFTDKNNLTVNGTFNFVRTPALQ